MGTANKRVAIGGISHETNTFSPVWTDYEDFTTISGAALLDHVGPALAFFLPALFKFLHAVNDDANTVPFDELRPFRRVHGHHRHPGRHVLEKLVRHGDLPRRVDADVSDQAPIMPPNIPYKVLVEILALVCGRVPVMRL